jgi:hypothetical protein
MIWRQDLRSKFIDGLGTALALYIVVEAIIMLVPPVRAILGRPGLLIYTLTLMAISVYCVEHSLQPRMYEPFRAWYGMFGGLIAWTSISLSNDLGIPSITSVTGILVMILFTLTVTRLWRRFLPLGGRFYSIALMLAWVAELIINARPRLLRIYPIIDRIYPYIGFAAVLGGILTVWWIFTQSDKRLDRLSAAPILTFCLVIAAFSLTN